MEFFTKIRFFFNFILCRNKTNHSDKVRNLLSTTMNDFLRNRSFCLGATDLSEVKFKNICSWRCFHTNWLNTYLCERLVYIQSLSNNFPFISTFLLDAVFPSKKFFRFFFFQLQNIVKIFVVHLKPSTLRDFLIYRKWWQKRFPKQDSLLKQIARTRLFCQRRRVLTVFRRRPLTIKGAFPVISPGCWCNDIVDGKYHIFIRSLSVTETVWTDSYDELKFYVSFSLNINSFLVLQKSTHVFLRQVDKTYEPMWHTVSSATIHTVLDLTRK